MTNEEARTLLTATDITALTMYGEARGEPVEGRIAVGCVIRNRVVLAAPRFGGGSFGGVCFARLQFSCWNANDPNSEMLWQHARTLASGIRMLDPLLKETHFLASGIVSGDLRDSVLRATHYYSPLSMRPIGTVPSWAMGVTPIARVGGHLFFRGV